MIEVDVVHDIRLSDKLKTADYPSVFVSEVFLSEEVMRVLFWG